MLYDAPLRTYYTREDTRSTAVIRVLRRRTSYSQTIYYTYVQGNNGRMLRSLEYVNMSVSMCRYKHHSAFTCEQPRERDKRGTIKRLRGAGAQRALDENRCRYTKQRAVGLGRVDPTITPYWRMTFTFTHPCYWNLNIDLLIQSCDLCGTIP